MRDNVLDNSRAKALDYHPEQKMMKKTKNKTKQRILTKVLPCDERLGEHALGETHPVVECLLAVWGGAALHAAVVGERSAIACDGLLPWD